MNQFLTETFTFNKVGDTPVGLSKENLKAGLNLVEEECKELREAIEKGDRVETVDSAIDLMVVSLGVMFRMGYTSQQVQLMMNAVSEANLSKFCLTEDEAKKSVEAYKQDGRYINVDYKFNEGYYVVFGSKAEKDGAKYKILKKAGWESPEEKLKDIVGG